MGLDAEKPMLPTLRLYGSMAMRHRERFVGPGHAFLFWSGHDLDGGQVFKLRCCPPSSGEVHHLGGLQRGAVYAIVLPKNYESIAGKSWGMQL